jgi:hypothetical protein
MVNHKQRIQKEVLSTVEQVVRGILNESNNKFLIAIVNEGRKEGTI